MTFAPPGITKKEIAWNNRCWQVTMVTQNVTQDIVSCKAYGYNTMYCLRGSQGFLCHFFWAAPHQPSVVLFSDTKTAKTWVSKVNKKTSWKLEVQPHGTTFHPDNFSVTINPSEDEASVNLILKKSFWQNW